MEPAATVPVKATSSQVVPPLTCLHKNQVPAAKSMLDPPALYSSTKRALALSLGSATSEMISELPVCSANVAVTVTAEAGMVKVVPVTVTGFIASSTTAMLCNA